MHFTGIKTGLAGMALSVLLGVPIGMAQGGLSLLSDPMLQLPTADSVRVVWYTEFAGTDHFVTLPDGGQTFPADTQRLTRMFEDQNSDLYDLDDERLYDAFTERPVWRHEATVTGLSPGVRVPYFVTSEDGTASVSSDTFSLQAKPEPGMPVKIVLSSDQQNRAMSPGTFQKLEETLGTTDLVLFAGDYVDNPHRASEWFDRDNEGRPAFFPSLQGNFQDLFPEHPYTGGEILQHTPIHGVIGNHESPGRFSKHAEEMASINAVDGDPQPRWYATMRYQQKVAAGELTPPSDPAAAAEFRDTWIRENSFEHTTFFEMWNHPEDGPRGESYWTYQFGDVYVIGLNVSRVWRNWNPGRGKFSEAAEHLNNPDEWGFGDMFFEFYGVGTEQYQWLQGILQSDAFQNAKYKVVLGHQTMFGLGDNSLPVMADPVATITYEDANNPGAQSIQRAWGADAGENIAFWEANIQPLLDDPDITITDVYYEYPIEEDIWKFELEPLLQQYGVDMVHTGHSHLWNRAQVGDLHYIETSNYGNSFGVGYDGVAERAPWANFPGDENGVVGPDPADYPRTGDAHGVQPEFPTVANPEQLFGEAEMAVPFVSSNDIGVFTVLDTGTGRVDSYAYVWDQPASTPVLFDSFLLSAETLPAIQITDQDGDGDIDYIDAAAILEAAGFVPARVLEPSTTVGLGEFIRLALPPGGMATPGSTVNVVISTGAPVAIPTLSSYAMLILASVLVGSALVVQRRRT